MYDQLFERSTEKKRSKEFKEQFCLLEMDEMSIWLEVKNAVFSPII